MKRFTPLLLSASVAVGCTQIQDMRLEARQRRMARAAYVTSPGACNGVPHSVDYAKGFEDGYYDVASGGEGCPPPLPPKKYWGVSYQSPVGQEHVKAWFQGFRDGAAAAKADGAAAFGTIYISDEHRNGIRRAAEAEAAGKRLTPQPATSPNAIPSGAVPPGAIPPTPGNPVQILGPIPGPIPSSSTGSTKPPMSDAQKAPPLRDVQNPPAPMPPPSAKRPDQNVPEPMLPAPMASVPHDATPLAIPAVSTIKQVDAKVPTPAAEPIKLKLPELELPAGFVPEASLGDPQPVTGR